MKRSLVVVFTLASGFALSAVAQAPVTPSQAQPAKVAVIFFENALAQTNEGQRVYTELQSKYAPKRAQVDQFAAEIQKLQKDLEDQGDKLSAAEQAARSRTIAEKTKQAQRFAEDGESNYKQEMQEKYDGIAARVYKVLVAYAQQNGYTLVLDGGQQQQATPLLYSTPSTDITKAIIDAYNLKSSASATPAKPAAAAPRPAVKPPVKH